MTRFLSIDQHAEASATRTSPNRSRRTGASLLAAMLLTAVPAGIAAAFDGWHTDWRAAVEASQESGQPILAVFTGSDWCPHCQLLEQHVLETEQFKAWAEGRVVPLMVDLPKQGLSEAVREQRSSLCRRYGVKSFPNVLLIAPNGSKIAAQPGYNRQAADAWIAAMDRKLESRPTATATPERPAEVATLDQAVREAEDAKRPVLVVVSRSDDQGGRIRAASLVNDPEFREFAQDNFVVAEIAADGADDAETPAASPEPLNTLLGGVPLPSDEVEVIVTYDGRTPMYTQSARQPTPRIISALRRFLGARPSTVRR